MAQEWKLIFEEEEDDNENADEERGLGLGATVGQDKGVAQWRERNWYRPAIDVAECKTREQRRLQWVAKQIQQQSLGKPKVRRRPNPSSE